MSDIQRTRKALKIINRKLAAEEWLYGLVAKITPSGPIYDVPGRAGFIYVRLRNANGSQVSTPARNDAGVPHSAGLPVRMYYEETTLVIDSVSRRPDLATVDPPLASGVPVHIHDDRYFREDEHVNVSAGAADAAKPVVLGATGLFSNTFLDVELSAIAGLTSAADRLPYYTGLGTASLATFTAFARTFLDDADAATVRATLGLIIDTNVQAFDATLLSLAALGTAADRIAYTTGVDTWAETPLTAYGRTLAALADAAALRANLNVADGATVSADEMAQDAVGGIVVSGNGVALAYVDATPSLTAALTTLTTDWDAGEDRAIMLERLEARDAEGLRIEDDGGVLSAFVQDATGYVGILNATPGYALDIKVASARSQMHFSGTNADSGGYMVSVSANNFFMSGGAHFELSPSFWVAKSTSAGIFGTQLGHFDWFADTGLTAGNSFTPTQLMYLDAAGLAVGGGVAPRGKADIKQGSTTAAVPVMVLEQADVDQDMIEFVTTIGTGNAIEAVGAKTLTVTHFIKVTLPGGLTRYLPCGTIA